MGLPPSDGRSPHNPSACSPRPPSGARAPVPTEVPAREDPRLVTPRTEDSGSSIQVVEDSPTHPSHGSGSVVELRGSHSLVPAGGEAAKPCSEATGCPAGQPSSSNVLRESPELIWEDARDVQQPTARSADVVLEDASMFLLANSSQAAPSRSGDRTRTTCSSASTLSSRNGNVVADMYSRATQAIVSSVNAVPVLVRQATAQVDGTETARASWGSDDAGPVTDESQAGPDGSGAHRAFAKMAQNKMFENTTLCIIVLNAFWIFIDVEWNNPALVETASDRPPLYPTSVVIENLFCTYFTAEVVIRFLAFERKMLCLFNAWFVFDFTLVSLMVTELWVLPLASALAVTDQDEEGGLAFLSIFRLLRLLRLSRMVRLMRYLPELMTLVKGMVEAAKTVWVVFMFLFFLMFVFALIFISLIGEPWYVQPEDAEVSTAKTMFGDLGSAMLALFTHGVLWDNLYQALMEIKQEGYLLMLFFLFFSLVSGMCLLNMLIGVLCQVMHQTSHREQEVRHRRHVEETLRQAFHDVDSSSDGLVCQDEWDAMRRHPTACKSLGLIAACNGVEVDERLDKLGKTLFRANSYGSHSHASGLGHSSGTNTGTDTRASNRKHEGFNFEEFMEKILELRWETEASSLDVDVFRAAVEKSNHQMSQRLAKLQDMLELLLEDMGVKVSSLEDHPKSPAAGGVLSPASAHAEWLRKAPTELLFHALKSRPQAIQATE